MEKNVELPHKTLEEYHYLLYCINLVMPGFCYFVVDILYKFHPPYTIIAQLTLLLLITAKNKLTKLDNTKILKGIRC